MSRGTISDELSLLRRTLRTALREGYKVSVPSVEDLIVRGARGGREISDEEQAKLLPVFAGCSGCGSLAKRPTSARAICFDSLTR